MSSATNAKSRAKLAFSQILKTLPQATKTPGKMRLMACCPAHEDDTPSLSVSVQDGKLLWKCFGGCSQRDVRTALGKLNLLPEKPKTSLRLVDSYTYFSEDNKPIFFVQKLHDTEKQKKTFRAYTITNEQTLEGTPGVPENLRQVYNAPYVRDARNNQTPLFFVEGEKDADTIVSILKLPATTIPFGSGSKWLPQYTTQFADVPLVVIIPDNDIPGIQAANQRAKEIVKVAKAVKILPPFNVGPDADNPGCDVTDWVNYRTQELEKSGKLPEEIQKILRKEFVSIVNTTKSTKRSGDGSTFVHESELPHTDMGFAERLSRRYSKTLKHISGTKVWANYEDGLWKTCESMYGYQCVSELAQQLYDDAQALPEDDEIQEKQKKKVVSEVKQLQSYSKQTQVLNTAANRADMSLKMSDFDADPYTINAVNGLVDLRTGRLLPHESGKFCLKRLPFAYRQKVDEPQGWLQFLHNCFHKDAEELEDGTRVGGEEETLEIIEHVQKLCGYALIGNTYLQKFLLLHGPGNTGKSTFLGVLRGILGTIDGYGYCHDTVSSVFCTGRSGMDPTNAGYELSRMAGARLVNAGEMQTGARLNDQIIKTITGGGLLTARQIRESAVTYPVRFLLTLETNTAAYIDPTDSGMIRRVELLVFDNPVSKADVVPEFDQKLLALEGEQILAWVVSGAVQLLNVGLRTPQRFVRYWGKYMMEFDVTRRFLEEICVVNPKEQVSTKKLYKVYEQWCEMNSERAMKHIYFVRDVRRILGPEQPGKFEHKKIKSTGNSIWGFLGLGLREDWHQLVSTGIYNFGNLDE